MIVGRWVSRPCFLSRGPRIFESICPGLPLQRYLIDMTDRRYNDKEMAAIFRAATEGLQSPQREVPTEEGLTLTELQAIGREVGISPDAVAQAAQALEIRQGAR